MTIFSIRDPIYLITSVLGTEIHWKWKMLSIKPSLHCDKFLSYY